MLPTKERIDTYADADAIILFEKLEWELAFEFGENDKRDYNRLRAGFAF